MAEMSEWVEAAENNFLLRQRSNKAQADKMLQWGHGNRILSPEQSGMVATMRAARSLLGDAFGWLVDICDAVEDYQLTVGKAVNSRDQFIDVVKFEEQKEHEKSRLLGVLGQS